MNQLIFIFIFTIISSLIFSACGASINTTPQSSTTPLGEALNSPSTSTPTEQMLTKLKAGSVITIPETNLSVTLTNDQTNFSDPNSNLKGNVIFVPSATSVSPTDVATILAITKEGSNQQLYLASFTPGDTAWQETSMVLLGEEKTIRSLATSASGIISISYLQRKPGQAVTAKPKVSITRSFIYQNSQLVERGTQM